MPASSTPPDVAAMSGRPVARSAVLAPPVAFVWIEDLVRQTCAGADNGFLIRDATENGGGVERMRTRR
jgi:hypothetical protein